MEQIADWLKKLGLSEYTERFVENGIEIDVLSELTDQDLEKLGVLLGHRRRMLRAIRDLGDNSAAATRPSTPVATEPTRQDSAERRQLTVMFCDLVGSTALAARLDLEDLRGIVGTYHRCCTDLIERNGGFVAKYMGDGVLAYFGYPQAHEHDAERAVRAGLALVEALPKLEAAAGIALQVRVGIATGLVVVGDLIGSGEAQERGIVGETPNLAARLQGIAEPNISTVFGPRASSGITAYRSIGSTMIVPLYLTYLSSAHAEVRQFNDAWRCIDEAMTMVETTKERWCEAEVHRIAGEIALMSPEQGAAKAEVHFERALAVACAQQAKSWELRAAMSMARLWGDQGKRRDAYDLLAPVYGWFTEGFDTLDLKEAKALLGELA
jgi:class 3 adenylate cyclase